MDINLTSFNKSFSRFLHRYHLIIFVVVVFGALGAGVYATYQNIIATNDARGYTAQTNDTSFDSATSAKIRALQPSDYRLSPNDPSGQPIAGRDLKIGDSINPFVE